MCIGFGILPGVVEGSESLVVKAATGIDIFDACMDWTERTSARATHSSVVNPDVWGAYPTLYCICSRRMTVFEIRKV